jgi:opacity protein-like surface antigen
LLDSEWTPQSDNNHDKEKFQMRRLLILVAALLALAPAALAQSDDYVKWEFYGGYSAMRFDNLGGDTGNTNLDDVLRGKNTLRGFNLAIAHNFHKYYGVKFDYSLHLRNDDFSRPVGTGTIDTSVQNFLGGLQIKNNMNDGPTFKPFAHALFGLAHQRITLGSLSPPAVVGISDPRLTATSFAMAFGGGIDIKLNRHLDVRAVQIDLNIINRGDQNFGIVLVPTPHQTVGQPFVLPGTNQDNLRLGAGIVVH